MLSKVGGLSADCVCLDLEDGVSASQKKPARDNIKQALGEIPRGQSEILVRINSCGSGLEEADLDSVLSADRLPDGLVLPKVSSKADLAWLVEALSQRVKDRAGSLSIVGMIESAKGMLNLKDICESAPPTLQVLLSSTHATFFFFLSAHHCRRSSLALTTTLQMLGLCARKVPRKCGSRATRC